MNLRRIILHMIEETAQHAGHLDTVRDSSTGAPGFPTPGWPG
jgi:Protein of unknown function (DUF664)